MTLQISNENEQALHDAMAAGGYENPDAVLTVALQLLRRKQQIIRDVKDGIAQLDRGEYTEYDEDSLDRFLRDIQDEQDRLQRSDETP